MNSVDQYRNIGEYSGPCFYRTKKLLSYEKNAGGWQMQHLNLIQLFFRKVFGWYKSTHLEYVFAKINKESAPKELCEKVYHYILSSWIKTKLICLGNSDASNAQIICFAENHLDQLFKTATKHFINQQYEDTDIVLIESFKAGEQIQQKKFEILSKLDPKCLVQGWDLEEHCKISHRIASRMNEKIGEAMKALSYFEQIKEKEEFRKQSWVTIQSELEKFVLKVEELNQYFNSESYKVLRVRDMLLSSELKTLLSDRHDSGLVLYNLCWKIVKQFTKIHVVYSNISSNERSEIFELTVKRNQSLADEISKFAQSKRKIYVIGGESHFLHGPNWPHADCTVVQEALQKFSFAIITRKNTFTDEIAHLNPFPIVPIQTQ